MAIQHAYADFNADVVNNGRPCPVNAKLLGIVSGSTCKIDPIVVVSAFANAGMNQPAAGTSWPCVGAGCATQPAGSLTNVCPGAASSPSCYFGGMSVANEHLVFPPQFGSYANVSTWYNGQAFSYHSYGKSGHQLQLSTVALAAAANMYHDEANVAASGITTNLVNMPVLLTEHQAHTNGNWNSLSSNCDSPFEASRLANQILSQAVLGYESYIFKVRRVLLLALRTRVLPLSCD